MTTTLEITINNRRFNSTDGVKRKMKAAELANLIGVPVESAIVENEIGRGRYSLIPEDTQIEIRDRMRFLITRNFVMGG